MKATDSQLLQALQLQEQGKPAEAAQLFRQLLKRKPQDGAALYSLALLELNHFKDRDTALRLTEAGVAAVPHYAPMHALRALALHEAGELQAALDSYAQALKIDPHYVTALINSSVLQQQLAQHHAALDSLQRVLAIEPDNALALANCGTLLTEFKRGEEAIALFERLLQVAPGYDFGLGMLCFEKLHICDWQGIEALRERIVAGIRADQPTSKTFPLLAICDEPRTLHAAARLFTERSYPAARQPLWRGEQYRHERIRIAYVSADLREHPVGHLLAGVIERHDKQRFETIGISLGIDDQSSLRARFIAAFDQFHDVQKLGSPKIAQLIRDLEVDILINLSGYTSGSRSEIFAQRPAPIQVNYLGYPGTLGADYIDYILADRHVTPLDEQDCYSEKIVQLPHAYLPTDGQLKVAEHTPTRAEFGLPDNGFVFCSFNHDYKISPEVFAIWMRLLQRVEGSVLWLMKLNEPAQRNLCRAAEEHGIDPQRLIFATRVPRIEDHLARYRLADLFLDCYPYNAHTTAADALFVGLPVLTYMGKVFQGRVAGSLLSTLEMPELITHSLEEYEERAWQLASDSQTLAALRTKLAEKRTSTPLYDTELFCRHVEAAYLQMWQRWQDGRLPEPFRVPEEVERQPARSAQASEQRPLNYWPVRIQGDVQVCVQPRIEQMSTYVLLEQEDWFEDEMAFVRAYVTPDMHALDIGANHGVYSLSIARQLRDGHVWAFEPTQAPGRMLEKSIQLNGFQERITWVHAGLSDHSGVASISISSNSELNTLHGGHGEQESIRLETLDGFLAVRDIRQNIEFVKLDAEGEEINVVKGGERFFTEQSPLVMFELKHGQSINHGLIDAFKQLGYDIYVLLPDLGILAAYDEGANHDVLNLFACKRDRADAMSARQLLARNLGLAGGLETVRKLLLDNLATAPYAQLCNAAWQAQAPAVPTEYIDALVATLLAHSSITTAEQKLSFLNTASGLVDRIISAGGKVHYCAWLLKIHLLHLQNRRALSAHLCEQLLKVPAAEVQLDWPFLPPRFDWVSRPIHGNIMLWLEAALREFIELRQGFSSYFSRTPFKNLQELLDNPNKSAEMDRRAILAARLQGRKICVPLGLHLLNPAVTRNSGIWQQILGVSLEGSLRKSCITLER